LNLQEHVFSLILCIVGSIHSSYYFIYYIYC
jgi:hypothetical protein